MKVVLANDSFPPLIDGVANTVVNYAEIIQKNYGQALVATPFYPNTNDQYDFKVLRYRSLNTKKLVSYRTGYPFSKRAMNCMTAFSPDIIHSHCPFSSTFLARELRVLTDKPIVFTYHTKFDIDIKRIIKHNETLQNKIIRLMTENIESCDEVWVVSEGAGKNLRKNGYYGKYRVMRNGVDMPLGKPKPETVDEIYSSYDIPNGIPVFIFVGRLMKYKGLIEAIDACALLKQSGKNFRMVFIGDGNDRKECEQYAQKCGVANKCIFTGKIYDREKIKAFYYISDCLLFPSTFDTNGLVVGEAASSYCPALVIENSCAAEEIEDGFNGLCCENTPQALYEKLSLFFLDRNLSSKLGDNAAKTLYRPWEESVKEATRRYEEVIDSFVPGVKKNVRYESLIEMIGELHKESEKLRIILRK